MTDTKKILIGLVALTLLGRMGSSFSNFYKHSEWGSTLILINPICELIIVIVVLIFFYKLLKEKKSSNKILWLSLTFLDYQLGILLFYLLNKNDSSVSCPVPELNQGTDVEKDCSHVQK